MASDKKTRRLQELRGSDFEIAEGQPDIRGWEVFDTEARKIGRVKELIFDVRDRKVRYMAIDVAHNKELQLEDRLVLVPIGLAQLDHPNDDVILQNVTPFQLRALPRYDNDLLGPQVERDISMVFGRQFTGSGAGNTTGMATAAGTAGLAGATTGNYTDNDVDSDFYQHEFFNDQNMYRNRSVNTSNERTDSQAFFGSEKNENWDNDRERNRQAESLAASNRRLNEEDEERIRKEVREKDREAAMLAAADKRTRDLDEDERLRREREQDRNSERLTASDSRSTIDEDRIREEERIREDERRKIREEESMRASRLERQRGETDEEYLRRIKKDLEDNRR